MQLMIFSKKSYKVSILSQKSIKRVSQKKEKKRLKVGDFMA